MRVLLRRVPRNDDAERAGRASTAPRWTIATFACHFDWGFQEGRQFGRGKSGGHGVATSIAPRTARSRARRRGRRPRRNSTRCGQENAGGGAEGRATDEAPKDGESAEIGAGDAGERPAVPPPEVGAKRGREEFENEGNAANPRFRGGGQRVGRGLISLPGYRARGGDFTGKMPRRRPAAKPRRTENSPSALRSIDPIYVILGT